MNEETQVVQPEVQEEVQPEMVEQIQEDVQPEVVALPQEVEVVDSIPSVENNSSIYQII